MDNILVESSSITAQLEAFKGEMNKLDSLFAKMDEELSSTKNMWEGNASETTLAEISKLKALFDSIQEKNTKYTEFLNVVIEKYTDLDDSNIETVESNQKAFNTDLKG